MSTDHKVNVIKKLQKERSWYRQCHDNTKDLALKSLYRGMINVTDNTIKIIKGDNYDKNNDTI